MPFFDQDGRQVDFAEVKFPSGVTIGRAVVRNSRVELFAPEALGGELALTVERVITHPGAGLGFEVQDWVEQE